MSEAMTVSFAVASMAACGADWTIGAALTAAGSIATDRAIIKAIIVRTRRIAVHLPAHIVCAGHNLKLLGYACLCVKHPLGR